MSVPKSSRPTSMRMAIARGVVRLVSHFVPAGQRRAWREGWEAELWHDAQRSTSPSGGGLRVGPLRLAWGALRHGLWELKQAWAPELVAQDVRYAVRGLWAKPAFALVAVVTVALGVGANTTIFTLINGLLFRTPAAIDAPERLVSLGRGNQPTDFDNYSLPIVRDYQQQADVYSGVAAFAHRSMILGTGVESELRPGMVVTGNYFAVLGVRPVLGRDFLPEEIANGSGHFVAIISHALWQRRHGGRTDILERGMTVNGQRYQVVGVAPRGFVGTRVSASAPDVWLPLASATPVVPTVNAARTARGRSWLWAFARLAEGVELTRATVATRALVQAWGEEYPLQAGQGVQVLAGVGLFPQERIQAERFAALLLGVSGLVLLISCANLANLLLVRASSRTRELGVRVAMGATRSRLIRQLLIESAVVSLAGTAVAGALTVGAGRVLPSLLSLRTTANLSPDLRVFGFALGVAVLASILFGAVPALRGSRPDVVNALKEGGRTGRQERSFMRRGLVVTQLALSFVLLTGTGLLLRSVRNAQVSDPGFRMSDILLMSLRLDLRGSYDDERGLAWYDQLLRRVRGLPGVAAAAVGASVPIAEFHSNGAVIIDGDVPAPGERWPLAYYNEVSSDYFETLGIRIVQGRSFESGDGPGSDPVVVINEALARRYWPGVNPLGRTLGQRDQSYRVIGVARDVQMRSLREPPVPYAYFAFRQRYEGAMTLHVRTESAPLGLAAAVGREIDALDAGLPVFGISTLRERVSASLAETRSTAVLVGIFGAVAVVLAGVGLYGVLAYAVAERRREMGIRIALGAPTSRVLRLVLGQGLRLTGLGILIGVVGTIGASRAIAGLLYEVSATDPTTLVAIAAVFALVGGVASYLPTRRATRVDPTVALREE